MRGPAAMLMLFIISHYATMMTGAVLSSADHVNSCRCFQNSVSQQLQHDHPHFSRGIGCCYVAAAAATLQVPVPRPCAHLQVCIMRTARFSNFSPFPSQTRPQALRALLRRPGRIFFQRNGPATHCNSPPKLTPRRSPSNTMPLYHIPFPPPA